METSVLESTQNEDGSLTIHVVISPSSLEAAIDSAFVHAAAMNSIDIHQSQTQEEMRKTVIDSLGIEGIASFTDAFVPNYLASHVIEGMKIAVIGDPYLITAPAAVKGQPYEFSFRTHVRPTLELNSYDPVEIERPAIEVSEDEVDALIQMIVQSASGKRRSSRTEVQNNDTVICDIETLVDDECVLELSRKGCVYGLGSGNMPLSFDEKLVGMLVGQTKEIDYQLPFEATNEGYLEKTAKSRVTLHGIIEDAPLEIDDEWVRTHASHAKTVQEFRDEVRSKRKAEKEQDEQREITKRVVEALEARLCGDIPDELYETTAKDVSENFQAQLVQKGFGLEGFLKSNAIDDVQFSMSVMLQARRSLRENLALDALFRHENLSIDNEDIESFLKRIDPVHPDELLRQFEEAGKKHILIEAVERNKAIDFAVKNAVIK